MTLKAGRIFSKLKLHTPGDLYLDQRNASQWEIEICKDLVLPAAWKNLFKKMNIL